MRRGESRWHRKRSRRRRTALLIGNFGDGRINVYDFAATESTPRAKFTGVLTDQKTGHPIVIDGLWALKFGVDAGGFKADNLYFTAGPDDEKHGAFGVLEAMSAGSAGTAGTAAGGSGTSTGGSGGASPTSGSGGAPYAQP